MDCGWPGHLYCSGVRGSWCGGDEVAVPDLADSTERTRVGLGRFRGPPAVVFFGRASAVRVV